MAAPKESVDIDVAGRTVALSNPSKVMFPASGETKLDLVNYYLAVEAPIMRAVHNRPILMERYPDGAAGKSFFQKRVPSGAPEWLTTTVVSTPNGTPSDALVAADLSHLIWAVNLGCLGFHVWPYHVDEPETADELRLDLDPMPGVSFEMVREAALELKFLLDELGMIGWPKTTGSKGIHVYVRLQPRWTAYDVRAAAVALARELERRRPDLLTAAWWKEERGTRVFLDFNQNAPHKTIFGAWSVRPKLHAPVSMPFAWADLATIDPAAFTARTVPDWVVEHGDPWERSGETLQSIEIPLEMSERDMAAGMMDAPWPPVYPKMPNEPPRVQPSRARKP